MASSMFWEGRSSGEMKVPLKVKFLVVATGLPFLFLLLVAAAYSNG